MSNAPDPNSSSATVSDSVAALQAKLAHDNDEPCSAPIPLETSGQAARRRADRYLVNWRIAVVYDEAAGKSTYHGRAHDLSAGGVSMLCDHNILFEAPVIVLLALPAMVAGKRATIIEIRSQMRYTILTRRGFRVGIEFLSFRPGELDLLTARLQNSVPHQQSSRHWGSVVRTY
jgi:hypothetical protein